MLTGLNLWACERQGPPDLFGNLHYNNHTISTHFSLSPQCRRFNTSLCDVSDLQEKMLKWCHVWKPCSSFMSHLFEYSQIKPELILQTFLHSPLHFLGLSASSQCGYYERSRNPSYCKPANTVTLYSIQAQHTSSYLEERNRSAGSASEPAHLHPWNASSCAPSSQIGCRWHHRGQQSSIWASPGALECQLARYVSPVFQICLVAWLQLKVVKNDAHKMSSY